MYDRKFRLHDRDPLWGDTVKASRLAVLGLAYQRPVVRRLKPLHLFALVELLMDGQRNHGTRSRLRRALNPAAPTRAARTLRQAQSREPGCAQNHARPSGW